MTGIDVGAVRGILDDANLFPDDRSEFVSVLGAFLASDDAPLEIPADPVALAAWGQALNCIASHLFGSAREVAHKALADGAKPASPKKKYELSISEYELWLEIQAEKSKSLVLGADGLGEFPSSEVFVVDQVADAEPVDE
jgi:hypothetical protein